MCSVPPFKRDVPSALSGIRKWVVAAGRGALISDRAVVSPPLYELLRG
jgi:hypothetical protein